MPGIAGNVDVRTALKGLGCERLTVDATAGGVALASIPTGATIALMRLKTANITFTDDGVTAPTATVGFELYADDVIWLNSNLTKFKAIRTTGSSGTLIVNYYCVA